MIIMMMLMQSPCGIGDPLNEQMREAYNHHDHHHDNDDDDGHVEDGHDGDDDLCGTGDPSQ